MQSKTLEQLTPAAAQTILANLPERIRAAFIDRAAEINGSPGFMGKNGAKAIASLLKSG